MLLFAILSLNIFSQSFSDVTPGNMIPEQVPQNRTVKAVFTGLILIMMKTRSLFT